MGNGEKQAVDGEPSSSGTVANSCYGPSRYQMTNLHRQITAELVALGAATCGFMEAVQVAVGKRFDGAPMMTPDAYRIRASDKAIDFYEAVIRHCIDSVKAAKIAALATWLQSHGWTMTVAVWGKDRGRGCTEFDPFTMEFSERQMERVRQAIESCFP